MAKKNPSRCTLCGSPVRPGSSVCSTCRPPDSSGLHPLPSSEVFEVEAPLGKLGQPRAVPNTLHECWRCNRLVQAHEHLGRLVMPRFCPWCGKPVSSILGRELDGYRLDEVIATGAFGVIFLASNIAQPTMKAAVKVLHPELAYRQPEIIKIFVEEARLTEEIGQACWNIVRVSNVREIPWPYFFMEYLRGQTLDQAIHTARSRRLPLPECVGYLRGIARALQATHLHGRLHRDLKPLNIMALSSDEVSRSEDKIKLLDFGLAMKIASRRVSMHPVSSVPAVEPASPGMEPASPGKGDSPFQSAGTPEYMAPESFDGVNDVAADIYSFGVTAYELIAGGLPWDEAPVGANRLFYWRDVHKKQAPRPLRSRRPDAPAWLARQIHRCLEKEPGARPRSATQLVEMLREPLSWRAKGALAVAALLLALLVGLAFAPGRLAPVVPEWVGDHLQEEDSGMGCILWVRSPEDLPLRTVECRPRDVRRVSQASASPSGSSITVEIQDGGFLVRFAADEELLGQRVRIVARGEKTDGESFELEGAIEVRQDAEAPRIAAVAARDAAGQEAPARSPRRLHGRKAAFHVEVDEPNPSALTLELEGSGAGRSLPGERKPGAGGGWSIDLSGLEPGEHRGRLVARDRAGNESPPGAGQVSFIVDNELDISPQAESWKPTVASGRACWQLHVATGELLESVEVRAEAEGGGVLASSLYELSDYVPDAGLVEVLLDGTPLPAGQLAGGRKYLLAAALPESARRASRPVRLRLILRDASFPANELTQTVAAVPPPALSRPALREIRLSVLRPDGTTFERTLDPSRPPYAAAIPAGGPIRIAVAHEAGAVQYATISGREGRELARDGLISFSDVALPEEGGGPVRLTLHDAFDSTHSLDLDLSPDVVPPQLKQLGALPYFPAPDKVDFRIASSEALHSVRAVVRGAGVERPGEPVSGTAAGSGRIEYRFPGLEEALSTGDGSYSVAVTAEDEVGNEAALDCDVVIDSAGPSIAPVDELEQAPTGADRLWRIPGRRASLKIDDANGVDARSVTCSWTSSDGTVTDVALPVAGSRPAEGLFTVDLIDLPSQCAGRLNVRAKDVLGVEGSASIRFELDRTDKWRSDVSWRDVDWVWIEDGSFYVSRTEISNRLFRHPDFFAGGAYRDPGLRSKYQRPAFWGPRGELPSYERPDGTLVKGDDFPVVGVSPAEAEAFARLVFKAHLPTHEEWKAAGQMRRQEADYPWRDIEAGKDWFNYKGCEARPTSAFHDHRFVGLREPGQRETLPYRHVEAGFAPFPPGARRKPPHFTQIWHLLGNVAELVELREGVWGICGGSFDTPYEQAGLRMTPDAYDPGGRSRGGRVGFRLVIRIAEADEDFRRRALQP